MLNNMSSNEHTGAIPKNKKVTAGDLVRGFLNGEFLSRQSMTARIPYIIYIVGLFLLNIALVYYFESMAREEVQLKHKLNELRSSYNTTMSNLEQMKRQSQVAKDIEQMGLKELKTPPQVIEVEPGYFDPKMEK